MKTINTNKKPFTPTGWTVERHEKNGKITWSLSRTRRNSAPQEQQTSRQPTGEPRAHFKQRAPRAALQAPSY